MLVCFLGLFCFFSIKNGVALNSYGRKTMVRNNVDRNSNDSKIMREKLRIAICDYTI